MLLEKSPKRDPTCKRRKEVAVVDAPDLGEEVEEEEEEEEVRRTESRPTGRMGGRERERTQMQIREAGPP